MNYKKIHICMTLASSIFWMGCSQSSTSQSSASSQSSQVPSPLQGELYSMNQDRMTSKIVEFQVPDQNGQKRPPEKCSIASHFNGINYDAGDFQREELLCSVDFYGPKYVACQKIGGTNPGLDIMGIPNHMDRVEYEKNNCHLERNREGVRLGKFKQSISCSYSPSVFGTYHLSRILGNVLHVPTAVLRTMDVEVHKGIVEKALAIIKDHQSLIYQTWFHWKTLHANHSASKKPVFTADGEQIFGHFYNIPTEKADEYMEFHDEKSYDVFWGNPLLAQMGDSRPIEEITISNRLEDAAQTVVRMKDLSDVILMDSLMAQQDRIGNIDYVNKWYLFKDGNLKIEKVQYLPNEETEMKAAGAVMIKEMLIQDSDCGLYAGYDNKFLDKGLLANNISHMGLSTYQAFMKFAKKISNPETKSFFVTEALFSDADFKRFSQNVMSVKNTLYTKCKNGKLRLDLNLEKILRNENIHNSQDYCDVQL